MPLPFLPDSARHLTERTSIEQFAKIAAIDLSTGIAPRPIRTTYIRDGQAGDRAPFLLLHGFDSSLLEYRRLQPRLSETRETYSIDLLGFGFTDRTAGSRFAPEDIDRHLHAFWKATIDRKVILVGASMGGVAAMRFALHYPEAVERLVLLDSAGIANGPLLGKLLFPPLDRLATGFLRRPSVRRNISRSAYFDKQLNTEDACLCAALHLEMPEWQQALIAFTKSGGYPSIRTQTGNLSLPTLVLWGRNDKILGTKDAAIFERNLPGGKLVWLDRCGHVPHLEVPEASAQQILDFCESSERITATETT
ncbi:MAG: alpha/beta fold hydrolase [Geitlerinemataceae cyanobacterium]